jgi:hypothetical protein
LSIKYKISNLLQKNSTIYIISNIIFSFSTYFVMLIVPYYLNINELGNFMATYQILLLYILIFELGLSISYIRYCKLYESIKIINSFFQIFVILILMLIPFTVFGDFINNLVNIDKTNINSIILYFSTLSLLCWNLLKSVLLSLEKFYFILIFSIIILIIRILLLKIISMDNDLIHINNLFLFLFIIPFIPVVLYLIKYHFTNIKQFLKIKIGHNNTNFFKIYKTRIKKYFFFSSLSFISSLIYGYTLSIIIIKLLELNEKTKLSEIGYGMTFIGIVSIFVISIRNFYISKFKFNKKIEIINFLNFINSLKIKTFILSIIICITLSSFIYLIKPDYLSNYTIAYTILIIFSYILISYFSMYTLLAKVFNENFLEIKINLIRCIGVYTIVYFYIEKNFDITLIAVYSFIPLMEYIYSRILISKINLKKTI